MAKAAIGKKILQQIDGAVAAYKERREEFINLADRLERELVQNHDLRPFIHSTKHREKDPAHLRDKLIRKATDAVDRNSFDITAKNLFKKIGDLAGVRLLHIHTEQLAYIHPIIMDTLLTYKYKLRSDPVVYIWDVERKEFFTKLGFRVILRPSLYTSVHYNMDPHWDTMGCELQVRTLAEELWGEVSHTINYPHETDSLACREQLAALARIASGCTRLVDSIFASDLDFKDRRTGVPHAPINRP